MQVRATQLGKKYRREWIFRNLDLTLSAGNSYTVVGPNGSGKSTLLQVLAGMQPATAGTITYSVDNQTVNPDDWYRHMVLAAPYLELIEELTLTELLDFHGRFKPFRNGADTPALLDRMQLGHARHKEVKFFSSGMKQRVKLGLAFFSQARLVLLDEPTANLDRQGIAWYQAQVADLLSPVTSPPVLLLLGSNQPAEYEFCPTILDVSRWKP